MKNQIKLVLGVAVLISYGAQAQVVNGGFETGDFTGWTQFGNTGFTGVTGNFSDINPEEGNYQAYFGPVGSTGGISQDVAGVVVGDSYDVTFWLYNFGGTPSYFDASFGGNDLVTLSDPNGFGYTEYSYDVVAANNSLVFTLQQNPSYFLLDNVSVTASAPDSGSTMAMMSFGLVGLGGVARRFRR